MALIRTFGVEAETFSVNPMGEEVFDELEAVVKTVFKGFTPGEEREVLNACFEWLNGIRLVAKDVGLFESFPDDAKTAFSVNFNGRSLFLLVMSDDEYSNQILNNTSIG